MIFKRRPLFLFCLALVATLLTPGRAAHADIDFNHDGLPATAAAGWHVVGVRTFALRAGKSISYPIGATGFNRDVVFENSSITSATPFDDASTTWLAAGIHGYAGLPTGVFSSRLPNAMSAVGTRYRLQDFTANNVLFLTDTAPQGALTLIAPKTLRTLSIAAASSNARFVPGIGTLTLNFQDGSTSAAINYNARDWWGEGANNDPNRIFATGLYRSNNVGVNLANSALQVDTI